jgi:hypothetical protein
MSLGDRLTAREAEILRILQAIYEERDSFTLIGGYAVDAYSALPRYSVDCDLVISAVDLGKFTSIFNSNKFAEKELVFRDREHKIETRKFVKLVGREPVSIDLALGGVKCRQTDAVWMYEEIHKSSSQQNVVGINGTVPSNVASRELLVAMKLHSGRDTDLKDVVMLAHSVDWREVQILADRGSRQKVILQLESAVSKIGSDRFEEQLRSFFGSKRTEETRINTALTGIQALKLSMTKSSSRFNTGELDESFS